MTMFEELYELASNTTLTLVISADDKMGRMTINVIPKPKKDVEEPALSKALSLTATPAEFDAEFVQTLKGYREARQSLAEQAEATWEVLQAAKTASTKKAGVALAGAAKATAPATAKPTATAAPRSADLSEEDDAGQEGSDAVPAASTGAAKPASESFDLFG